MVCNSLSINELRRAPAPRRNSLSINDLHMIIMVLANC